MILIVDADQALAENCSMFLESSGYDVDVALSGTEALSKIKSKQPALLISDCCMPDLTRVQLSKQPKTKSESASFPILLMSGWRQCQVEPGKSYDAFIRKPFLAEDLLMQVRKLMNTKGISPPTNNKELL